MARLWVLLLAVAAAVFPCAASAAQIKWTITPTELFGGPVATVNPVISGSFIYDADTNTYSAVAITVSPGTFDPVAVAFPAATNPNPLGAILLTSAVPDATGSPGMWVQYTALTNAGGTVMALFNRGTCLNAPCNQLGGLRFASTTITGTPWAPVAAQPIPTLSTWGLLAMSALLAAAVVPAVRRRKH